jgi:hypothetical protein
VVAGKADGATGEKIMATTFGSKKRFVGFCLAAAFGLLMTVFNIIVADDRAEVSQVEKAAVESMRAATLAFLQGLTPALREQATFDFDDEERQRWSNLPNTMFDREGISFGEMSSQQRVLAHRMLESALTGQGYLKTSGIMHLDEILVALANARGWDDPPFGLDHYWIGIFGDPQKDANWGWQLDGHHLALNFTVAGDEVSVTPAFMGTDPAEIRDGPHAGWRVLADEDDLGRALFDSLNSKQREKALLSEEAPRDIFAGAGNRDQITEVRGLPASEMTPEQRALLVRLILVYMQNVKPGLVAAERAQMWIDGVEELHFSWMGSEPGEPYYYRVHGLSLWIEFDNSFPPGSETGPINHIHSIWRNPRNDYGKDLLREHYETSAHHQDSGGQ